jgi:predicted RNA-binding Zn-ribbon protein involved in translation (DUF1610 family)
MTRSELISTGYKFVIFGKGRPFTEDVNCKIFWLGQGCTNCDTWIAGNEANFHNCPNCGKAIAYAEQPAEPRGFELTD